MLVVWQVATGELGVDTRAFCSLEGTLVPPLLTSGRLFGSHLSPFPPIIRSVLCNPAQYNFEWRTPMSGPDAKSTVYVLTSYNAWKREALHEQSDGGWCLSRMVSRGSCGPAVWILAGAACLAPLALVGCLLVFALSHT